VKRLYPRALALLALGGTASVLGVVGREALKSTPAPPQKFSRISQAAEQSLSHFDPYLAVFLVIAFAAVLFLRRKRPEPTPQAEMPPAPLAPVQAAGLVLLWAVGQAAATIPILLIALVASRFGGEISDVLALFLALLFGTLLGVLLPLFIAFKGRLPDRARLGLRLPHKGKEFLWGFLAFLSFPALVAIGTLLTLPVSKFDPFQTNPVFSIAFSTSAAADWILLFALVALLGPVIEEFLFRGLLYRSLRTLWSPGPAIIISAVFFASIHPSLATLLPITFLGMALAYLYEKTGSIVPGMVAHGLYNGLTLALVLWLQQTMA